MASAMRTVLQNAHCKCLQMYIVSVFIVTNVEKGVNECE